MTELDPFAILGPFSAAGRRAVELALARGAVSEQSGRIPIAGAAVHRAEDGALTTVGVGCNGRIPEGDGVGYPVDHGETAAVRNIGDISRWDWSSVVFATTLSPCIMCTRTLVHLHALGLRRIVVAESQSFAGRKDILRALPGMQIVELETPSAVAMMNRFARRWPWDWAADIGEIPAGQTPRDLDASVLVSSVRARGADAGVFNCEGQIVSSASDRRGDTGENPVFGSVIAAIGHAGSAVNIREHGVVVATAEVLDVSALGLSSLGAMELFRPACLVVENGVTERLAAYLSAVDIDVWSVGGRAAGPKTG